MDLTVYFFQFLNLFSELIKRVAETTVCQFQRIEQKLSNLHESAVSSNSDTKLRLDSLEESISNINNAQLRQEKKMQELQDLVKRSFEQLNQQLSRTSCDQELKQKEESLMEEIKEKVMSTDTKVEHLQDLVSRSFEKSNQQLKETNFNQELKQTKESNETQLRLHALEEKMQELQNQLRSSFEKSNQQLNEANCDQELKQKEESLIEGKTQKMQELHNQLSNSFEKSNQQLNEANSDQELKQKEENLMEKKTQEVKSMDSEIIYWQRRGLRHILGKSVEQLCQQLNIPSSPQPQRKCLKKAVSLMEEMTQEGKAKKINKKSGDMLKDSSSINKLLDNFLFGSKEEQKSFESLCLKWVIKHKDMVKSKEGSQEHLSDIFPVYGFQLKAQLRFTIISERTVELRLCFKDDERKGQAVDIKVEPIVTFIIKDLSGQNKNIISCCYSPFKYSLKYNKFYYWTSFSKTIWKELISPRDNSMEVLVLMEPPANINKPLSVDGTITDTIEHYSMKLQLTNNGLIDCHWSPAFLTHTFGYRVAVGMCLNRSIGSNTRGLAAWIHFLSGEFDSLLKEEFEHETSITLINQLDPKKNITVEIQAKKANSCYIAIASEDTIRSGGFLMNDSLTYHVTIKSLK